MRDPSETLVGFGRFLRGAGLPVGTNRILTFCRAVAALGPGTRDDIYWAGRTTLVSSKPDIERYDRLFKTYFAGSAFDETIASFAAALARASGYERASAEEADLSGGPGLGGEDELEPMRVVASSVDALRSRSFEDLSQEERAHAFRLIRNLEVAMPRRRSRRLRPAAGGARFDVRRTLRKSLKSRGEPFIRAWRRRAVKPRPLVLLLDVSGSMAVYSRALLQFAFAVAAAGRKVEVFCFGTRLTRVTHLMKTKDPDRALEEVARTVQDWSSGTRIGGSVKQLLDRYSQHVGLRASVVVVCSDGLERDDPQVLSRQMERLQRVAHSVVWVNPLRGNPDYRPLARGMAAALPHVDRFLPGHNLHSLEELARSLSVV